MRKSDLNAMDVSELMQLRGEIDALLSEKVTAERRALQQKLAELDRFSGGARTGARRGTRAGSKVAPKYVGPNGETWAGRGARPRWLRALLDEGRDLSEFAIDGNGNGESESKPARGRGGRGRGGGRRRSRG